MEDKYADYYDREADEKDKEERRLQVKLNDMINDDNVVANGVFNGTHSGRHGHVKYYKKPFTIKKDGRFLLIEFKDKKLLLYDEPGSEYNSSSYKKLDRFIKNINHPGWVGWLKSRTEELVLYDAINSEYYGGDWTITNCKNYKGGKRTKCKRSKGKRKRSKTRSRK
jgi:hypothetical protein